MASGTQAARIAALECRVADLEQQLFRRRRRARLDDADVSRLVLAIAGAVGGAAFTARDLLAAAVVDQTLRDVLGDLEAQSARRLGKALHEIVRRAAVHGFILERVNREASGHIWALRPASM